MYIELKAFESEDSPRKIKIQLNVGTPFSADTKAEIGKEKLEPKRVYDVLQFITNDLIPRIVIKHNQHAFATELAKLQAMRDKGGVRTWEQFYESATADEIAEFKDAERLMLDHAIKIMDKLEMPVIQQINFDELSPGRLAISTASAVNSNVPPPRWP